MTDVCAGFVYVKRARLKNRITSRSHNYTFHAIIPFELRPPEAQRSRNQSHFIATGSHTVHKIKVGNTNEGKQGAQTKPQYNREQPPSGQFTITITLWLACLLSIIIDVSVVARRDSISMVLQDIMLFPRRGCATVPDFRTQLYNFVVRICVRRRKNNLENCLSLYIWATIVLKINPSARCNRLTEIDFHGVWNNRRQSGGELCFNIISA